MRRWGFQLHFRAKYPRRIRFRTMPSRAGRQRQRSRKSPRPGCINVAAIVLHEHVWTMIHSRPTGLWLVATRTSSLPHFNQRQKMFMADRIMIQMDQSKVLLTTNSLPISTSDKPTNFPSRGPETLMPHSQQSLIYSQPSSPISRLLSPSWNTPEHAISPP